MGARHSETVSRVFAEAQGVAVRWYVDCFFRLMGTGFFSLIAYFALTLFSATPGEAEDTHTHFYLPVKCVVRHQGSESTTRCEARADEAGTLYYVWTQGEGADLPTREAHKHLHDQKVPKARALSLLQGVKKTDQYSCTFIRPKDPTCARSGDGRPELEGAELCSGAAPSGGYRYRYSLEEKDQDWNPKPVSATRLNQLTKGITHFIQNSCKGDIAPQPASAPPPPLSATANVTVPDVSRAPAGTVPSQLVADGTLLQPATNTARLAQEIAPSLRPITPDAQSLVSSWFSGRGATKHWKVETSFARTAFDPIPGREPQTTPIELLMHLYEEYSQVARQKGLTPFPFEAILIPGVEDAYSTKGVSSAGAVGMWGIVCRLVHFYDLNSCADAKNIEPSTEAAFKRFQLYQPVCKDDINCYVYSWHQGHAIAHWETDRSDHWREGNDEVHKVAALSMLIRYVAAGKVTSAQQLPSSPDKLLAYLATQTPPIVAADPTPSNFDAAGRATTE